MNKDYYYVKIQDLQYGDEVVLGIELTYIVKNVIPLNDGLYEIAYTNGFTEIWNKQDLIIKRNW